MRRVGGTAIVYRDDNLTDWTLEERQIGDGHPDVHWLRVQHACGTILTLIVVYSGWGRVQGVTKIEYDKQQQAHIRVGVATTRRELGGEAQMLLIGDLNAYISTEMESPLPCRYADRNDAETERVMTNLSPGPKTAAQRGRGRAWEDLFWELDMTIVNGNVPTAGGPVTFKSGAVQSELH